MKPIHVWQLGFFALAWSCSDFFRALGFFFLLLFFEFLIDCSRT